MGPEYEVLLVAYSRRGPSNPAIVHRQVNGSFIPITEQHHTLTLELVIMLIVCPIIVIGIIIMVAVNHYLSKRVRDKEMNKYFKVFSDILNDDINRHDNTLDDPHHF